MTGHPFKALIVDDATTVRMYHRSLIEEAGWTTVEAENGVEAMEKVLDQNVDLMFVDVNMPIMDGYTFIKTARATGAIGHVPIVMISTEAQKIDRDKAFEAGANHYLVKPASPQDISNLLTLLSPKDPS